MFLHVQLIVDILEELKLKYVQEEIVFVTEQHLQDTVVRLLRVLPLVYVKEV
jgi:hypothetical protein